MKQKIGRSRKATKHQSDLYFAELYAGNIFSSDLKGNYQNENIRTVLQTVEVLKMKSWEIDDSSLKSGLQKVVANTESDLFELLQQNYGDALAVEMEGRGILEAAHTNQQLSPLIIRGIDN